ncbi:hypothetical protein B0H17DRAFT_1186670 [Mycena rosella]|uniref:Uncharacterized protein n=1 Tax=Mycena rosella TaxID=1033263 RepID=A0AAD7FXV1_MYCRO|nr:hypothetical protein B0H17DRAFT_1186670 [Mycena rosella]
MNHAALKFDVRLEYGEPEASASFCVFRVIEAYGGSCEEFRVRRQKPPGHGASRNIDYVTNSLSFSLFDLDPIVVLPVGEPLLPEDCQPLMLLVLISTESGWNPPSSAALSARAAPSRDRWERSCRRLCSPPVKQQEAPRPSHTLPLVIETCSHLHLRLRAPIHSRGQDVQGLRAATRTPSPSFFGVEISRYMRPLWWP